MAERDDSDFSDYLGGLPARDSDSLFPPPSGESPFVVPRVVGNFLLPNISNPQTYQPLPPLSMQPTAEGKIPQAGNDPRVTGVIGDIANLATYGIGGPEVAGAKLATAVGGLGLARRVLGDAGEVLARRTDLPTRAFHGTNKVFPGFVNQPVDYMIDPALGTHAAADPALASSFADRWIKPATYYNNDYSVGGNPHVIPLRIPAEERFLQADQPRYESARPDTPLWKSVLSDQTAIERMAAESAYKQDPDLLARYLQLGRAMWPADAFPMARALASGETREIGGVPHDLKRLISNYGGKPFEKSDRATMVDLARKQWQDQGYAGIRYINTAPMEAGAPGVKDPTSYIIFDPKNIRSEFAQFDPRKIGSTNLLAGVGGAAVATPVMSELMATDRYRGDHGRAR
jgi:hypothetical protein